MNILEQRIVVLEQSAKALASLPKPHKRTMSDEGLMNRWDEIAAREIPEKTLEEIREEFRVHAAQLCADFELRHGNR